MEQITAETDTSKSMPIVSANIDHLAAIFPEAIVDGKVDFDVLRQLLGDDVEESDERYGLTWHGKRQALQLAQTPSTGTLRPCPEDSEEWDTTKNLMIEGDNLEVLKLLQKSYAGKVKLIYIDPPYNTGDDFVYKDNYRDNIANYLEQTGQLDEEGALASSETETSGRFHTMWLNMIYPRLVAAKHLLSNDGVCFISIGGSEGHRLRVVCDAVFGEDNFVGDLSRITKTGSNQGTHFGSTKDQLLVYARSLAELAPFKEVPSEEYVARFNEEDDNGRYLTKGLYQSSLDPLRGCTNQRYWIECPDGTFVIPPGEVLPELVADGEAAPPKSRKDKVWRWSFQRYLESKDRLVFKESPNSPLLTAGGEQAAWSVYTKQYLAESLESGTRPREVVTEATNELGSAMLKSLGMSGTFDFPKPPELLTRICHWVDDQNLLALDFFAGSGTTGHAVMAQNAKDGGSRRFILVQLPESLDPEVKEQQAAAEFCDEIGKPRNLAELTKERLRRAATKIAEENPDYDGDLGFRAFKLDSSNIRGWDESPEDLEESLLAAENHVKEDRTDEDLLYELLLKQGIDLSEPIETKEIAGHNVQSIGAGTLITCLDQEIAQEDTQALGEGIAQWHEELDPAGESTCIFRDSAFPNDVAKTNLTETLHQNNINTIRSI